MNFLNTKLKLLLSLQMLFFFQVLQKENKIQNNKRYSFKVYTEVE